MSVESCSMMREGVVQMNLILALSSLMYVYLLTHGLSICLATSANRLPALAGIRYVYNYSNT